MGLMGRVIAMIRRTTPAAPQPAPTSPPQVRQQQPAPQFRANDPDYNAAVEEWLCQRRG